MARLEKLHGISLHKRGRRWAISYNHPSKTTTKRQRQPDGTIKEYLVPQRKEVVLKHEDGSPVTRKSDAEEIARAFYPTLVEKRMEAARREPEVDGTRVRWGVLSSIDDWLEAYDDANTKRSATSTIKAFREFVKGSGGRTIEYLDELTAEDARRFRSILARQPLADQTKQWRLQYPKTFLNWCVDQDRLEENPFAQRRLKGFVRQKARDRQLVDTKRIVHKAERDRLLKACATTQERLIFTLCTLVGLRPEEVVYLRWGDFQPHNSPPTLSIRRAIDDVTGREWRPKTGERIMSLIYPEVVGLIEEWRATTPHETGPDDWIIQKPQGGRYKQIPRHFVERLQRETGINWTPQVGRHTACSLLPLMSERLTGSKWTQIEHAQHFGHSFDTSVKFYIVEDLVDLASKEGLTASENAEADTAEEKVAQAQPLPEEPPDNSWDVDLARTLLIRLRKLTRTSVLALGRAAGVSDNAVRRFEAGGASIPRWYFNALRALAGED